MSASVIKPENLPEKLIWYYIISNYAIYLFCGQYFLAPLLATFLAFYVLRKWWRQSQITPLSQRISISTSVWVWLIAMIVIEIALIVGHVNFDWSGVHIFKSSLNWYRKWFLLALFPIAGYLDIRPKLLYRALCILCLQHLIFIPLFGLMGFAHINVMYYSPLKALGGGELLYQVIFGTVVDTGQTRFQLFTPWPPALGLLGVIDFLLTWQEEDKKWRFLGMAGAIAAVFTSVSRLAMICVFLVPVLVWLLRNFFAPKVQFTAAISSLFLGMFLPTLINTMELVKEQFHKFRAGSSRVRSTLGRIAIDRWWNEAPVWGHGQVESRGPALVGHMPIGSHHTWYGLLFNHGLVGGVALGLALFWSFIELLIKAQQDEDAKVALGILVTLILFSFGENIETLAYLYWPGLIMLGIGYKKKLAPQRQKVPSMGSRNW